MTYKKIRKGAHIYLRDVTNTEKNGVVLHEDADGIVIQSGREYYYPWTSVLHILVSEDSEAPDEEKTERVGVVL